MLRDYQQTAISKTYASLRENVSTLLQMPTGSGKTHVAMDIIKHGLKHDRKITFAVDRITLLDQTLDKFYEAGIPFGVVQGDHPMCNYAAPVQIASLQTLQRRGRRAWPDHHLCIIDEAHTNYSVIGEMIDTWNARKYIGLTATPFTRGLGLIWNDLVVATTTKELIERGYLAEYEAFGPSTPDLTNIRRSGADFSLTALEERMNVLTGDIVAHYKSIADGKKGLYFTPTVAYAQFLADEFMAQGVMADHVSGHDSDERRKDVLNRYRKGDIQVVTNCEVLTKGFDMPDIEVGGLCRPTRSLSLHIQMLGRFLRRHGDTVKLILDHSGNIERLGFPDDPLPQRLDMGEEGTNSDTRQPDEPQPWNCPKCHSLVPPRTPQCTVCGHMARRRHEVEVQNGVLQRLSNPNVSEQQQKQEIYSQLIWYAHEHGYSEGWAAHKYKKLHGVFPRKLHKTPEVPSQQLLGWITNQNIAYAKRKEGHRDHY
jgi:superfamily II DNA or RNA helicase